MLGCDYFVQAVARNSLDLSIILSAVDWSPGTKAAGLAYSSYTVSRPSLALYVMLITMTSRMNAVASQVRLATVLVRVEDKKLTEGLNQNRLATRH